MAGTDCVATYELGVAAVQPLVLAARLRVFCQQLVDAFLLNKAKTHGQAVCCRLAQPLAQPQYHGKRRIL